MGSLPTKLRVACCLITLGCFGCSSTDVPEGVWNHPESLEVGAQSVYRIAFSPTGDRLISLHYPSHPFHVRYTPLPSYSSLQFWTIDLYSSRPLMSRYFDRNDRSWSAFDTEGEAVLAITQRGIWRYDIESGTSSTSSVGDASQISSDGTLFVREEADGSINVRQTDTGSLISTLEQPKLKFSQYEFSPDSKLLVECGDHQIHVYDVSTGQVLANFETGYLMYPVCFSHNRKFTAGAVSPRVWIAAYDQTIKTVRVWSLDEGKPIATYAEGWEEVRHVAFSNDGAYLAVSGEISLEPGETAGLVRFWNLTTGDELEPIRDESTWGITALAFSPDGTKLATGDGNGVIKLWPLPAEMKSATASE